MRKTLMTMAAVFLLLASSLSSIAAQSGTPSAQLGSSGGGVTPLGTAITVTDNNGQPSYTIAVDKLEDPFTGFDPSNAPQRGFHFVAIDISIFNAAAAAITGAGQFSAVDSDGFANQQSYVYRTATDGQIVDYNNLSVDPGKIGKAVVFFQVLNDIKIAQIVFQPDYQRWITVLNTNKTATEPGTKIAFVDTNLQPAADITVTEIIVPLTDFDPSSPPQRGFEYAGINVTITNTGKAAFIVNPTDFTAVDVDGFAATSAGLRRASAATATKPDLQYGASIDPGKSLSGVVSFQILKGSKINQVFYAPNGRFLEVANLAGKALQITVTPGPDAASTPVTAGNASAGNASAGNSTVNAPTEAAAVPTPDLSGIDCAAVVSWAKTVIVGTLPVFTQVAKDTATWQSTPNAPIDTAKVRADAKLMADTLASIKDVSAPTEVQPLADAYAGIVKTFGDSLTKLANDLDAKDTAAVTADLAALNHAADAFSNPQLTALTDALASACPDLNNLNG